MILHQLQSATGKHFCKILKGITGKSLRNISSSYTIHVCMDIYTIHVCMNSYTIHRSAWNVNITINDLKLVFSREGGEAYTFLFHILTNYFLLTICCPADC